MRRERVDSDYSMRLSRPSRRRWLLYVGVCIVTAFVLVSFGETYLRVFQLKREAARLEEERQELQRQNAQLREEIKLLQTSEYVERLARERLGLVKPGEIALRIVETPPSANSSQGKPQGRQKTWWERMLQR